MKNYIVISLMSLACVFANNQHPTQEQIDLMLEKAFEKIWQQAMEIKKEINNPKFRQRSEDLLSNLASSAPASNFVTHADLSETLAQAENTSASVFVSTDNQGSWIENSNVAPLDQPGFETTWGATTQTSGGNNVDWYLSGSVDSGSLGLSFGQMTVSQSPYNQSNQFPPASNLYALLGLDDSGDTSSSQDIVNLKGTYSDNKLYGAIRLNGNCCNEGGLFGPWYLYVIAIVNPDATESNTAYALGYGSGGFGQLYPALYKIDGDLATGAVNGFEALTEDFQYSTTGNDLQASVDLNYLINDADWGPWPNSFNGVVLLGTTVEAGLSGLDVAIEVLDTTNPGVLVMSTQSQDGNTPPVLSNAVYDNGFLEVNYTDADNNLATVHDVFVDDVAWTMVPDSHDYLGGVTFRAEGVSGGGVASLLFSDGYDTVSLNVEIGPSCGLAGDVNADGAINVQDIVSVVSYVLGSSSPNDEQFCAADLNEDGAINVQDIVSLVNIILN